MTKRRLHLVAYDIADPRTRARALKVCKAHGFGGQKSAHECFLSNRECGDLGRALERIVTPNADRLLILRVDSGEERRSLGRAAPPPEPLWFYLG